MRELLERIEATDPEGACKYFRDKIRGGEDPSSIHLSLFPVALRVLNPPFFNGHMPKMYSLCRNLIPYLAREEVALLVLLEINEYAKRPLLKLPVVFSLPAVPISFAGVESALSRKDRQEATILMAAFTERNGRQELARRILLLGSGYLDKSLGHSVSCSAFILREILDQPDQDPLPGLLTISDFFCNAEIHTAPDVNGGAETTSRDIELQQMLRAVSGRGIINLHHTLTRFAMDRVRHLFKADEYDHLTRVWTAFMGDKKEELLRFDESAEPLISEEIFQQLFSKRKARPVVGFLHKHLSTKEGRRTLGRLIIKGVCRLYQGNYDPHYLTGLASALWTMERFWDHPSIAANGLFQYLDFYFENLQTKKPGTLGSKPDFLSPP